MNERSVSLFPGMSIALEYNIGSAYSNSKNPYFFHHRRNTGSMFQIDIIESRSVRLALSAIPTRQRLRTRNPLYVPWTCHLLALAVRIHRPSYMYLWFFLILEFLRPLSVLDSFWLVGFFLGGGFWCAMCINAENKYQVFQSLYFVEICNTPEVFCPASIWNSCTLRQLHTFNLGFRIALFLFWILCISKIISFSVLVYFCILLEHI